MKAYFVRTVHYTKWANQRSLESLRAHEPAQATALPWLAHILAAEHVWLSRLMQQPAKHTVWPSLSLPECELLIRENVDGYLRFLSTLGEDAWDRTIHYTTFTGHASVSSIADILTHLMVHGSYHRGQIAKAIGQSGGESIATDYIVFAREHSATP